MLNNDLQLLRRNEVIRLTARSRSSLLNDEKAGLFCPPVSIGGRSVAYVKHEVEALIQARIQGKTTKEIRELVSNLIKNREDGI
ncbi:AlpA family phage regulatory protein [Alteromonas sp. LMIT006]|uniref:helix-turn-helix transcriptional regulator n=1 Tax=Alteromonadaceae TaxID=72275 RepID=UPI0020CA59B2|nr:AlpA family phage regulatory protein [Alteromonas sp. LMIT006]UTP72749.1 AlpA family phage regulatory protein [Alteromonas sp. LMIT006]